MKCPKCDGKGTVLKIIYEDWQKDEIVRSAVKCPRCNGSGELPMTNEEWFCALSTEEKADWFVNSGFLTCTLRSCDDCKYYDKKNDDCSDGYEASHDTQMWVEWLKQPHTFE